MGIGNQSLLLYSVPDVLSRISAPLPALTIYKPWPIWLTDLHIAQERDSFLGDYQQLAKQVMGTFTMKSLS